LQHPVRFIFFHREVNIGFSFTRGRWKIIFEKNKKNVITSCDNVKVAREDRHRVIEENVSGWISKSGDY